MSQLNIASQVQHFSRWRWHPAQFVREVFKAEPDAWQEEVLEAFPHNQRIAMRASKGPGKSTVLAWLAWNFLLTRPHPRVAATSITGENLADGLWTELAVWYGKSPLLQAIFTYTKTRIELKEHPTTWFMSARSWSKSATAEEQGKTLAGLHAPYILFLIDESGGIPLPVVINADAALSSCTEGHIVQAGNTTDLTGPLYRACTTEKHLWYISNINGDPLNPKRSPRVSVQWAQQLIDLYGRDHPYVKVNVLGEFPNASFKSLIGVDEVEAAMRRLYAEQDYCNHPKILGIDVAREGDDSSIIFPRQGLQAFKPLEFRNINGTEGASHAARKWKEWGADGTFVDATGGFGSSWIDNLVRLGFDPVAVHFSQKSSNPDYFNKRTEIIFTLIEWVKRGGALPNVPELIAELTESTYTHKADKLLIEPKELLKEKIKRSPDHMDALALTFAAPVEKAPQYVNGWKIDDLENYGLSRGRHTYDYRPLSRAYLQKDKKY